MAVFGDSVRYQFRFEKPPDRPGTVLTAVYPSSDTVPANLLKIYLEFSAPMREGEVYQRLTLLDQNNDLVKEPFVQLQPELWDSTRRRITLWLDPGRVKRALASSTFYGPVLEDGKSYCLQIDSLWKDVYGHRLGAGYKKKIVVTTADRKNPEIGFWTIKSPSPNTREPLIINFNEKMDLATALKAFSLWTAEEHLIKGEIEIGDNESSWKFIPTNPWAPGEVQLRVESNLEDLAGNNLNRPFERDILNNESPVVDQEVHQIKVPIGMTDQSK
jgi:hypothetical protein